MTRHAGSAPERDRARPALTDEGGNPDAGARGRASARARAAWTGRKWGALQTVAVGNILIQLAMTPTTIALPTISRDLQTGVTLTGWIMTAYLMTLTGCMLVAGRLGDLYGHRRVFLAGIVVATVAGVAPFFAPDIWSILVLRGLQGLGGALIMGNGLAILTDAFDERDRGRAIGSIGMAASAGSFLGTVAVPFTLDYLDWRWLFLINLPLGLVGALSALSLSDANARVELVGAHRGLKGLDWSGASLLLAAVTALSLSLSHLHDGPETFEAGAGWHLTMHALAAGLLVAFVGVERRASRPIVDLGQFRNRLFTFFIFGHGVLHFTMMGQFFLLPFMLERGLGLGAGASSQFIAVTQVFNTVFAFAGGWLYDRTRSKAIVVFGMVAIAASVVAQGLLGELTGFNGLLAIACVASLGMGVFQTTNNTLVMSVVAPEQRGFASGLLETVRQLGHGVGITVMGAVVTLSTGTAVTRAAQSAAFVEGFRNGCLVLGALAAGAALLSWLAIRATQPPPGASARPAASAREPGVADSVAAG